jgi:hypothetical protein
VNALKTTTRAIVIAALMLPLGAAAEVQDIEVSADATIFEENLAGANGQGHLFVGNNADGDARRALLIFDVRSIPQGSTINSVTFSLQCTRGLGGVHQVALHRLTKSWTEGSATGTGPGGGRPSAISFLDCSWRFASFTAAATDTWLTPGGDYDPTVSATLGIGGSGSYDWSSAGLASDVSGWVNNPSSNFGWILIGDEVTIATARRFDSGEDTVLPVISVDFSPPTPVEATTWGGVKALYDPN